MYSNLKSFSFEKYSHVTFLHSSKLKFLEKIRQPCVVTQFTWHEDAQQCLVIHLHLGMALMISQNLNPLHSRKLAENAWHRCGTWDNWSVSRATYRCMPHGKSASIPAIHVLLSFFKITQANCASSIITCQACILSVLIGWDDLGCRILENCFVHLELWLLWVRPGPVSAAPSHDEAVVNCCHNSCCSNPN
jgi:hypothetical protein